MTLLSPSHQTAAGGHVPGRRLEDVDPGTASYLDLSYPGVAWLVDGAEGVHHDPLGMPILLGQPLCTGQLGWAAWSGQYGRQ